MARSSVRPFGCIGANKRTRDQITQIAYPLKICGFGVGNYTRLHAWESFSKERFSLVFSSCLPFGCAFAQQHWRLASIVPPFVALAGRYTIRRAIASPGSLHDLA